MTAAQPSFRRLRGRGGKGALYPRSPDDALREPKSVREPVAVRRAAARCTGREIDAQSSSVEISFGTQYVQQPPLGRHD